MSRARDFADLAGSADAGGITGRNIVIGGCMRVAQRGTSFNNISSDTFVVDRFFVNHGSVTPDVSQQTVTVGGETGLPVQFTKYARCDFNVSGGANLGIVTRLEDTEKYVGTHTVSFYAKGTNPTGGQMAVRFIQRFGSGGSSQVIVDPTNPTFTLTSTWQRFEIDVELPSVSGKTLGSGRYLQLQITQPNADSGTGTFLLDITGVQLEVGTATPFEHEDVGTTLRKCQRYFQDYTTDRFRHQQGYAESGTAYARDVLIPQMRANPTVTVSDENRNGFDAISAAGNAPHRVDFTANCTVTGTSRFYDFKFTADAEL